MEIHTADPTAGRIKISFLLASKTNPRTHFDPVALKQLSESVKTHGVIEPLIVRPHPDKKGWFEIIAGERRWRAATMAQVDDVPARIMENLTDEQVLELQLIENVQREDLHPLEEANGYHRLVHQYKHTVEDLVLKTGKSKATIYQRLQLTRLAEPVKKLFLEDKLKHAVVLRIGRLPSNLQEKCAKEALKGWHGSGEPFDAGDIDDWIERNYLLDLTEAPFNTSDEKLLPKAGACATCPKRTGNQPELFGDIKSKDICTDPPCFADKIAAYIAVIKAAAAKGGQPVAAGADAKKLKPHQHGSFAAGVLELDDPCYDHPNHHTWRKLLGKRVDEVRIIFVDPYNQKKVVDIADRSKVMTVLKDMGVKMRPRSSSSGSSRSAGEKERERKIKLEREIRMATLQGIHDCTTLEFKPGLLGMIAQEFFSEVWHEKQKMICKLWDWKSAQGQLAKLTAPQACKMIIELAAISDMYLHTHSTITAPKTLNAIAAAFKVDHAKIRRELTAAATAARKAKAKKKPKAKPAKKK